MTHDEWRSPDSAPRDGRPFLGMKYNYSFETKKHDELLIAKCRFNWPVSCFDFFDDSKGEYKTIGSCGLHGDGRLIGWKPLETGEQNDT